MRRGAMCTECLRVEISIASAKIENSESSGDLLSSVWRVRFAARVPESTGYLGYLGIRIKLRRKSVITLPIVRDTRGYCCVSSLSLLL